MSKSYQIELGKKHDLTLRAIYAWMLSALGSLDVELPRIDADWKARLTTYINKHPDDDTTRHGLDFSSVESAGRSLRSAQARHESGTGRHTREITSYVDRVQMYADAPVPEGAEQGADDAAAGPSSSTTAAQGADDAAAGPSSSTTGRITPLPRPPSPDATPRTSRVLPRSAPSTQAPPRFMVPPDDRQEGSSRGRRQQRAQRGTRGGGASRGGRGGRKGGDAL